jgi:acyl-CoA synthetase (AMP-forming)/AMP-acid ligase II
MTIRAVDSVTRRALPPGEIGELAVCGHLTPGYFRAPELDAEAFDRDGWFLTGDLGSIDCGGRVRFRGRLKEMIKTGGVNVAPLEVEEVLLQYPEVAQAFVVGVPDRAKGEIVAAAIELRRGPYPARGRSWVSAANGWRATRCRCGSPFARRQNSRARPPARSTSPGCARSLRLVDPKQPSPSVAVIGNGCRNSLQGRHRLARAKLLIWLR